MEEEEDPKVKKDPKKAAAAETTDRGNEIKVEIDVCNPNEEQKKLGLKLTVVYQPPDYEDDTPIEEDPKKKGKEAAPAEPEIRMVTPDPEVLDLESGREFEIELGRIEQVPIAKSDAPPKEMEDQADEGAEENQEEVEIETEEKWVVYKVDQSKEESVLKCVTEKGVLLLENLTYELNEEFTGGWFELVITDKTRGLSEEQRLPPTRMDLRVFNSEQEAEAAANAAAAGKKKK